MGRREKETKLQFNQEGSCVFATPFDSSPGLGELQGLPGYSAGLGVDPAGGAPGDSIGYPRTRASDESSTTKHRLHMLHDLTQSRHLMTLMESRKNNRKGPGGDQYEKLQKQTTTFIGCLSGLPCWHLCLAPTGITRIRLFSVDCGRLSPIRSTTRSETPSSGCTRSADEISTNGFSTSNWPETISGGGGGGGGVVFEERRGRLVLGLGL
ncbi:hypothetical protein F511_43015 [Dorcoceras hygrometricum]|uniref:Uncharacterized protein n=1 Tax=Dorcoceras hygrometricum TaxID=472368 RepID=A0A2Z7BZM8_9LAMI|nr:hypothetical protein F511_43015 [Dorcoceras hygrometricum]